MSTLDTPWKTVQAAEWVLAAAALVALDSLRAHADEPAIAYLIERTEALKAARDTLHWGGVARSTRAFTDAVDRALQQIRDGATLPRRAMGPTASAELDAIGLGCTAEPRRAA